jgi:choline-sulfatase
VDKPNLILLITDQQRYPQHWPDGSGFVRELMPNDAELARTGLTFHRAFCNTCMCTPSRATLFSGQYPAQHGLTLTLTRGDMFPDRRNSPFVMENAARMALSGEVSRQRLLRTFVRGMTQSGPKGGNEPELRPETQSIAHVLRAAGYHVALKGKWHLTKPADATWRPADAERLERDFGFADWDPPDAGENSKAENFGGGVADWDEKYTSGVEEWLGRQDLPEPFCLVVSLINPHDVIGYPAQFETGGYTLDEVREIEVPLPPTLDEDLSSKPNVHGLMRMGNIAYLGALRTERQQRDYVSFYAYLHKVVDEKIGRVLASLGSPGDPQSLRSRTVIVRCADHGEMGLSHGGLRQKMFNVYEETIRVPLVVSSPALFDGPRETDAMASLVDVFPTLTTLAGADTSGCDVRGRDLCPVVARHARGDREPLRDVSPADSVRDSIHFTYDDHQAATALQDVGGQPNRIRAVRDGRMKYAVYFDPTGQEPSEYELYDLERDPLEVDNIARSAPGHRAEMAEQLAAVSAECATDLPMRP